MYAVIMAGGNGSRLRPLTCNLPKPMVKLCGKPILEYILELLQKHGINSAGITVRYLSDVIVNHFQDKHLKNMDIKFFEEDTPLGTAGSVKNATRGIYDNFLVISGDAITDFNLTAAVDFHISHRADATVIVKNVQDPREYGLVNTDQYGNITGFIEKPGYSQVNTDVANTGIYILNSSVLDLIPDNINFDFAKDVFPLMMNRGMSLMAYRDDGYWCDIGDLNSYLQCQKDILNNKVKCSITDKFDANGNIFKSYRPYGNYVINPPVYIGENVKIEDDTIIDSGTVIGDNCVIGRNVKILGSCVQDRVLIDDSSSIINAIICEGTSVKKHANLFEGSTIGFGSVIGRNATIYPNIKVWPQKYVEDNVKLSDNLKYTSAKRNCVDEEGIIGEFGIDLTPEFCVKIGTALGSINSESGIAVGAANNPSAVILKNALITGIQSTGRDVWDFGNNFESLFTYGMNICNLNLGTFIDGNEHCTIKLYSENGLSATRDVERSLEATLLSGDYNRSHWSNFAKLNDMKGISAIYRQHLKKLAPFSLKDVNAVVYSENKQIENMMNETLKNLGVNLSDDTVINIDKNGTTVSIKSRNCYDSLSYWRIFTICCLSEFEKGYDISIPIDAPQIIDKIAQGYNVNVYRYFRCPAGNVDEKARQITKDQLWVRDALIMSIKFLSFLKISGKSIAQLHEIIPEFSLSSRTVISDKNPAALIRELAEINKKFLTKVSEGILINYENGYALIRPLKQGKGINILAESARTEFATEICDNIQNLIKEAKS